MKNKIYNNKKRGQSAIEWGVLLPFLILIIASVLELAPLMNTIIVVDKSTQYSARTAAVKGTSNEDVIYAYAQNMQGIIQKTDILDYIGSEWKLPGGTDCREIGNARCKLTDMTSTSERDPATGKIVTTTTNSRLRITSRPTDDGVTVNEIEVVPGAVADRFSTSWVMVGAKHQYKILTPVLQAVLSGKCESDKKGVFLHYCNYFPIAKTSVYRVE